MHFAIAALVLSTVCLAVNSEHHSLEYVYTALSRPYNQPGIHEFTAMGLLNNRMIDYYDNDLQRKIPKQDWMKERLDKEYWDKGTQSRKFKEQWFKVNIGILMERMRQNNSDVHTLQWRHGCEIEEGQDSVKFIKGFDLYSYDGNDFLSFDDTSTQWVAPSDYALPTKRKWDGEQILNQYTKGYLEKECVDWLKKFMGYGKTALSAASKAKPPVVYSYGKQAQTVGNIQLTCWATGFLPKDIILEIRKNEEVITKGVESSGVRPNDDDTHQIWKRVEIPVDDKENYDCFVSHSALPAPVIKLFPANKCDDCPVIESATIGGVVGFIICVILVGGVLFILYKKGILVLDKVKKSDPSPQLPATGLQKNSIGEQPLLGENTTEHMNGGNSVETGSVESGPQPDEPLLGKTQDEISPQRIGDMDSGKGSDSGSSVDVAESNP